MSPATFEPQAPEGRGRMLTVSVLEGRDAGLSAPLPEDGRVVRAGSSRHVELTVHDGEVSPEHVALSVIPGGLLVRDLGSRTGTFVGPVRVIEAVIPPATRVRIGQSVLSVGAPPSEGCVRDELAREGLLYESAKMAAVAEEIRRLSPFAMSVLIEGETGTGKEVVARALHALSMRKNGPFVFVDCGALPTSLVEAELFGHERGAFTGAQAQRAGAFELAHGGTLFLDEVGELPRESQAALLGVLQRRCFRRVGGAREVRVDVRVVAATNRDLHEDMNAGVFRSDLYYRLATARITLPPLRERLDDLGVLAAHFFAELCGDSVRAFSARELNELRAHHWPGNVRELRAVVERAVATGQFALDRRARPSDPTWAPPSSAPLSDRAHEAPAEPTCGAPPPETYRDARARALVEFERSYLEQLITACAGNASEAARVARMDRPHLLRMLRRHHLR